MGLLDDHDDRAFREELDRATIAASAQDRGIIAGRVMELASKRGRYIDAVRASFSKPREWLIGFNCFAYALGFHLLDLYWSLQRVPQSDFVGRLILGSHLRIRERDAVQDSDLILYRSGGEITHAGVVRDGAIVSKWGCEGSIYWHSTLAVPKSFGSELSFFCPMDVETSLQMFRDEPVDV